ncbi:hypothetical protein TRFO_19729 [Tritrichomonas foetus]|uniref:Uncharacterized protein n=1 Tax=Tritrichomonas foetus TaxID=1144522 RepID=A0A1J4KIF8_9EUKA|nr:hypothetical protein TRFO_19729 [Tritrichomonas foetus]|eukprot:OHT10842.1 hypothetical protein TRFO_19729 [Tritrichomonas foetus]
MLCLLFAFLSRSYDQCPAGVAHLSNTAVNVTLVKYDHDNTNGWYYFYSEYINLGDSLTVRINPSETVELVQGHGLKCPDQETETQLRAVKDTFSKQSFTVSGDPGLSIFGIRGQPGTQVIVSVLGKNPNNSDKSEWITISSIFLALSFVLLILLFVHAILARGRVHYQVEVDE